MAFELDFVRDPVTDRVMISCHDVEEGDHTLAAGERIRVQIGPPGDPREIPLTRASTSSESRAGLNRSRGKPSWRDKRSVAPEMPDHRFTLCVIPSTYW